MRKFIILTIIAILSITGCDNSNITNNSKKRPGKFAITKLSDTMGDNAARGVSLGTYTITNSESIFFILRNVGDFPITGITIVPGKLNKDGSIFEPITGNEITANPSAITVLETSGNTVVESVIKVNINHGDIIGLIAQQHIQKADFAGTTLRITGKTRDENGAVLDVSIDLDIETLIKVASFDVMYSLDNGVTFEKAEFINPGFIIPSNGTNVTIKNTGSADIRYTSLLIELNTSNIINPGNYSEELRVGNYTNTWHIKIDTLGIVFDNQGLNELGFVIGTSFVGVNGYWTYDHIPIYRVD